MTFDSDEITESLIEDLRPRLCGLIAVQQVLDHLHIIGADQKERIRQKEATEGNLAAAHLLLDAVTKRPREEGWFQAFVDALEQSGCGHAADYIQVKLPEPEVEAENDYYVKLVQLMVPSLVDMKTETVCVHCASQDLITDADKEIIDATTENKGRMMGARQLLSRVIRGRPGWFSKFIEILRETEHMSLYYELTGSSAQSETQGSEEKSAAVKDEAATQDSPAPKTCDVPQLGGGNQSSKNPTDDGIGPEEHPDSIVTDKGTRRSGRSSKLVDIFTDLYEGPSTESSELSNSQENSQPDRTHHAGPAKDPENSEIVLRDYQMEVARPALQGENVIICLPTGSGKTRVAVYITKKHLDSRKPVGRPGKVVVLVNKIPLVEQHFAKEFLPCLKGTYKVERVSGDSVLKISFTEIVKKNDVIICTAQILENYLERSIQGEDEGVNLNDLTLVIIDECHHTQKGDAYNHIMMRYLKQKLKNTKLKKEQKQTVPLPQILGLTASPGVGSATKMDKAVDHILRICANLDATKIMAKRLEDFKKDPRKRVVTIDDRKQDPFGDLIKTIMNVIHEHAQLHPTCELGSQLYEQWVIQRNRKAATEEDQKVRTCAEHLRRYNDGLILCNTIRMQDSFLSLCKFYEEAMRNKRPVEEHVIQITDTERFLFNLFKEHKEELQMLARNPEYENNSLSKLRTTVLHEFSTRTAARGIIFTKTRLSAIALSQWFQENSKFADIGVKASYLIGGGDQSDVKPMTPAEQREVLNKFRDDGDINLLIATTVAEEGLDIPECNFVIRYGHVTNEIAMIQGEGRGRAEDSSYTVVEVKNSGVTEKECVNEYRKDMMNKAIDKIRGLSQAEYDKRILEFQYQAIMEDKVKKTKKKQKEIKNENPSDVTFSCRGCNIDVCSGEDIEVIENVHKVNVTEKFRQLFILRENTTLQERSLDYETNAYIACKKCGERWGSMMLYHSIECPSLHVRYFVVTINGRKIAKCTKWSELPVKFPDLDYVEFARRMVESSDDEDN